MSMSNRFFNDALQNYFFGRPEADKAFYILQVTKVEGLAVEFNFVLPQDKADRVDTRSGRTGALRIDFAAGVQSPVKLNVESNYQPLSSNNLEQFVIYVSDIVFDYAGLDAQATRDRKSPDVTSTEMRPLLPSARFLQSAKRKSIESVVSNFFRFVSGGNNELLRQLDDMGVFTNVQIQSIDDQTKGGDFLNRLSEQENAIMNGADIKDMQRKFNSLLTKEYPKLLGPIEESKDITTTSDEDDSKQHLYIAMGIAGVLMLGFVIGRRRDRI